MSTANFMSVKEGFPMIVNTGMDYEDEWMDIDFKVIDNKLKNEADFEFFKLDVVGGYYAGYQIIVDCNDDGEIAEYCISAKDEEEADYNFGKSCAEVEKEYNAEKDNVIQYMRDIQDEFGLSEIKVVGIFSNGEAVYEFV